MMTTETTMKSIMRVWVMIVWLTAGVVMGNPIDDPLGYAVIVQQSPAEGGVVMPASGVMTVTPGEKVTLTAKPNPGYRFVYWLGDVSNATASSTIIQADSPKLVIAVFEREEFEKPLELALGAGGGNGSLHASPYPLSGPGATTAGTGPGRIRPMVVPPPQPPEEDEGDFPVPGDDNTIPEPATILLLACGMVAISRIRCK